MQPVSPIPHLAPSAGRRPLRSAYNTHAFSVNLAEAVDRLRAPSQNSRPSATGVRGASISGAGHRAATSLLHVERPRVYWHTADRRRLSGTTARPTDSATTTLTASGSKTGRLKQAEEATKAALLRRIHAFARQLGIDPALGEAVARAESGLDQTARSSDGQTEGAFQIKRITAAAMQQRLTNDPAGLPLSDEVTLGIGYLRYLDRLFATRSVLDSAARTTTAVHDDDERRRFAIAAYNAGEGRVAAAQRKALSRGGDPRHFEDVRPFLPAITRRYVDRVLAFADTATPGTGKPAVAAGS